MAELAAFFTDGQASELAGISRWQLGHWRKTGVLPRPGHEDGFSLNSFRDVVALRTLAMLRSRLSLQKLRELSKWLHAHYEQPWSSIRFYVAGKELLFKEPKSGEMISTKPHGQKLIKYELEAIVLKIEPAARRMLKRGTEHVGKITPRGIIEGTRISAATIQRFEAAGYTVDAILKQYPNLRRDDVEAALAFEPRNRTA